MRLDNISGFASINEFVENKIKKLSEALEASSENGFYQLYRLMFSESSNVMYERNNGFRIEKITYKQSFENIQKKTAYIKANYQFPENTVVGLYMNNSLDWIENFWAILHAGYKPILLNLRLSKDIIENTLSSMKAAFVISDGEVFSVKTVNSSEFSAALNLEPVAENDETFGSEILLMSSGTSSNVKVCAYTAQQFASQINNSYRIICESKQIKQHYDGQLKLLTFLPFYHIFGLSAVYMWFGFFSRTFVQLNDLSSQTVLNTIRKHKVTHIFAVPLFWETVYNQAIKGIREKGAATYNKFLKGMKLADKIGDVPLIGKAFIKSAFKELRENLFGESICFLITGGSLVKPEVIRFFNNIGYLLANGYGMTEIGITSVELSSKKKILKSASIGNPVHSVEYKINEEGQLLVRGKGLASRIYENGISYAINNDWFNTKDLAVYKNGRYYLHGRCDDVIVSASGENLNPYLIESKLMVPSVKEVCLINDELPVLLVSTNKYISVEKFNEMDKALKDKLAQLNLATQLSKIVYLSESFIKGEEFKINRKRITADYKAGAFTVVKPTDYSKEEESALIKCVKEYFASALNKSSEEINIHADFFLDEGGTSLDYFSMIAKLQNEFAISFPSAADNSMNTVEGISNFIQKNS